MKRNLLTSLILITAVLTSTVQAFGATEIRQRLLLSADPAVSITKESSNESGTIRPETGAHDGLNASFKLMTNGSDTDYDYIVTSKTTTFQGEISAFYRNGGKTYLIFTNTAKIPTQSEVEAMKSGQRNRDVIAYPFDVSMTSPMTINYTAGHALYGDCYVVRANGATEGTLSQTVGAEPLSGSYVVGHDSAGSYRAVVTFTAVAK